MATGHRTQVSLPARLVGSRGPLALAATAVGLAAALALVGFQATLSLEQASRSGFLGAHQADWALLVYALTASASVAAALLAPERWRALALCPGGLMLVAVLATAATAGAEGWSMACAVLTLTGAWATGAWLLRLPVLRDSGLAGSRLVALVAGLGVFAPVLFVLGLLGLLRPWSVGVAFLVLGLLGAARLAPAVQRLELAGLVSTRFRAAAAGILLVLGAFTLVWASAPEIQFDALQYKAWLPALWADTGRIETQTMLDHPQTTYIGLGQLVAVPAHTLGGDGVGRFLQLLVGVILVALAWRLGDRVHRAAGPLAALAVALTPQAVWQASTAYDDLLLALLVITPAVAVLELGARPARPLAAGLVLGFLAATCVTGKLHLAAYPVALGGCWCLVAPSPRDFARRLLGFALGAAAIGAPLLVYRWVETGNPVYPYLSSTFGSSSGFERDIRGFVPEGTTSVFDLPNGLWRLAHEDNVFTEVSAPGNLGPLVLLLCVAVLVGWRAPAPARVLWGALCLCVGVWWLQFQYMRFLLPFGVLATLVALPALGAVGRLLRTRAAAAAGSVIALVAACAFFVPTAATFFNVPGLVPLAAAVGREDPDAYERRAVPEAAALRVFERVSAEGEGVTGGVYARAFSGTARDLTASWELYEHVFDKTTPAAPAESRQILEDEGIRWVVLADDQRLLRTEGLAPGDALLVEVVRAHGRLVFADRERDLYELREEPAPPLALGPAGFCDEELAGAEGCWFGAAPLDGEPGLSPAETEGEPIGQIVTACPGAHYAVETETLGEGTVFVWLVFESPDTSRGSSLLFVPGGVSAVLYATAPPGATAARLTVDPVGGEPVVERVAVRRTASALDEAACPG